MCKRIYFFIIMLVGLFLVGCSNTKLTSTNTSNLEIKYTVIFETNGGTEIPNKTVSQNGGIVSYIYPEKDGYLFAGWYLDSLLTQSYNHTQINQDITLYAKWILPYGRIEDIHYYGHYLKFKVFLADGDYSASLRVKNFDEILYTIVAINLPHEFTVDLYEYPKRNKIDLVVGAGYNVLTIDSYQVIIPEEPQITSIQAEATSVNVNSQFILEISLDNPDELTINQVIINGEVYHRFEFLEDSTLSKIRIQVDSGNEIGNIQFTVEEMKAIYNDTTFHFSPLKNNTITVEVK